LGQQEFPFLTLLNEKELEFLLNHSKQASSIYGDYRGISPGDSETALLFDSIQSKEVKFSHSFKS
jgi:hypothetical protein